MLSVLKTEVNPSEPYCIFFLNWAISLQKSPDVGNVFKLFALKY